MKNILRENMRRFRTKNLLSEQNKQILINVELGGLTIDRAGVLSVGKVQPDTIELVFKIQDTNLDIEKPSPVGMCSIQLYPKSPSVSYRSISCTSGLGGTADSRDLDLETLIKDKIGITTNGQTFQVSDNVKSLFPPDNF